MSEEKKYTRRDAQRAVARGVKWLDKHVGPEWPRYIKLKQFNIAAGCSCVLGQVIPRTLTANGFKGIKQVTASGFGLVCDPYVDPWTKPKTVEAFRVAKESDLILTGYEAERLGFDVPDQPYSSDWGTEENLTERAYHILQEEWTEVIGTRKAELVDA